MVTVESGDLALFWCFISGILESIVFNKVGLKACYVYCLFANKYITNLEIHLFLLILELRKLKAPLDPHNSFNDIILPIELSSDSLSSLSSISFIPKASERQLKMLLLKKMCKK